MEEKRYAILTRDSVKVMAEATGHSDISDSTAALLGEDISYRVREMTQKSAQFMRHAKRRRLNADDFNKACKQSDLQPVYGHRTLEPPSPFRQTRDGDIYFDEDPEISLPDVATNIIIPKNMGQTTIKAHWLAIEGVQRTSAASQNPQGKALPTKHEVSDMLLKYYDKITQAILGFDEEMMKTALADLRSNSRITPLLPHFVNFISNGVKTVSHDVRQLTKLLYTVNALACNSTLFLEPQPYLVMLIQGVTYCLLEPLAASINPNNDHWCLRDYAARLLAHIVSIWGNSVNHLERFTEKTLREVLYDHSRAFCSHYGAVMGLKALGSQNLERVLVPHLPSYWPHLNQAMENSTVDKALIKLDAHKTYAAILLSVEFILKEKLTDFQTRFIDPLLREKSSSSCDNQVKPTVHIKQVGPRQQKTSGFLSRFDKSPLAFYNEMYEYFGDHLSMRMPVISELKERVFKASLQEVTLSLADPEAEKTGEELLEELVSQVKKQEELDRQRREQEAIHRQREREKRERVERQRMENDRKLVEERQRQLLQQLADSSHRRMSSVTHSDEDEEVDVEGDVKSDRSENSEKSDEEEQFSSQGAPGVSLAVKSTVSGPGQGIKLTITKRPRLKLNIKPVEPQRQAQQRDSKETRLMRKRKHSLRSPKEVDYCELDDNDDDFDNKVLLPAAHDSAASYTTQSFYSSEGEGSSDGGSVRKPLTLKIKKKDTASD